MDAKRATTPEERHELREVVGLFDTVDTLQSAIDDLLTGGFDRSEISLLAEEDKVREKLGDTDVSADSLEDSPQRAAHALHRQRVAQYRQGLDRRRAVLRRRHSSAPGSPLPGACR